MVFFIHAAVFWSCPCFSSLFDKGLRLKGVIIHIGGNNQQNLLGFDKEFQRKDFSGTDFQQDIRVLTSPLVLYNAFANKGLNLLFYEVGDFRSLEMYPNPYFSVDSFYQDPGMSRVNIDYNVYLSQGKDSVRFEYVYQGKTWGGHLKPGDPFEDENVHLSISNLDLSTLASNAEEEKNVFFQVYDDERLADDMLSHIRIEPNKETFSVSITGNHPSKSKAALMVELLMESFMDFHLDQKMESIEQSISFLDEQIDSIKPLYDEALVAVRNAEAEKGYRNIEALGGGLYEDIKNLQQKLVRIEYVISVLEWFVVMVEQEENLSLASTQLTGADFDGVTNGLSVDEILRLEADKEKALMQVTPEHPAIVLD